MYKIIILVQLLCLIYTINSDAVFDDAKCVCVDKDMKFITTMSGKRLLDENSIINTLNKGEQIIDRLNTILDKINIKNESMSLDNTCNRISNESEQSNYKRYLPRSCAEATANRRLSGIYNIQLDTIGPKPFQVSCVEELHGGGWTVVLRRKDGTTDFYRTWAAYKHGFGNIDGEFFIGLDKLYALTNGEHIQELIFVLEDFDNVWKYAKYSSFAIGDESEGYVLKLLGSYSGDAGDAFTYQAGHTFKTKDIEDEAYNCSQKYTGAWWYNRCHKSNLCGAYLSGEYNEDMYAQGVVWEYFRGLYYSLKFATMMIRPQRVSP